MNTSQPYFKALISAVSLFWLSTTVATETPVAKNNFRLINAMGTIICDGKIRGSATHISVPQAKQQGKSVLISAAHVLFDKKTGEAFNSCQYRPQNKRLMARDIDVFSATSYTVSSADKISQAEDDIIFMMLEHRLYQPSLSLSDKGSTSDDQLQLIAYSAHLDRINLSQACSPIISTESLSPYLLLHDCKAQAGTSGGAIVDTGSGKIVAIHGGALVFDQTSFESGSNDSNPSLERYQVPAEKLINQGRIIDSELISDLESFISANNKH